MKNKNILIEDIENARGVYESMGLEVPSFMNEKDMNLQLNSIMNSNIKVMSSILPSISEGMNGVFSLRGDAFLDEIKRLMLVYNTSVPSFWNDISPGYYPDKDDIYVLKMIFKIRFPRVSQTVLEAYVQNKVGNIYLVKKHIDSLYLERKLSVKSVAEYLDIDIPVHYIDSADQICQ